MKDKIVKTCLNIDCPERFSLCCHAGSRSATEPEILLGVPAYFCAKCGKEFEGGKCTAGEKELPSIIELTERIVIDYANLSGRESANRAEFREKVKEHISQLLASKSEQMERELVKIPKGKHTGKSWCPQCEDEGFNAGISKCQEILKK